MLQTKDPTPGKTAAFSPGHVIDQAPEHDNGTHAHENREIQGHEHGHIESSALIRIAVTGVIAALVWFRVWEPFSRISFKT
jgi:hypothetical protein